MGIALGLTAALCWGVSDVTASVASRRTGAFGVVLGFHVLATAALLVLAAATGALGDVTLGDLPAFGGLGALGAAAYVAFYRALAIGPISIVSPVVSGYAAVTVVLALVVLGERLSALEALGVVVAFAGVVLVSTDLRRVGRIERTAALGLLLAIVAMVALGGFVFGLAYYAEEMGWLLPLLLGRGLATVALAVFAGAERRLPARVRLPRGVAFRAWPRRVLLWVAIVAALDTAGYATFNVGVGHADTAIVATFSSPYAVVPILAGVLLLAERPAPVQWLGIALVVAGLVVLGSAS